MKIQSIKHPFKMPKTACVIAHLVELAHDEHRDPHEVKDAVEKHPEHPRRAGGDLSDVNPEAVFSVAGGTVNPPVCRDREML